MIRGTHTSSALGKTAISAELWQFRNSEAFVGWPLSIDREAAQLSLLLLTPRAITSRMATLIAGVRASVPPSGDPFKAVAAVLYQILYPPFSIIYMRSIEALHVIMAMCVFYGQSPNSR